MRGDDARFGDMRMAAEACARFVDGRSRAELESDEVLAAALSHQIMVIGEAARAVTPAGRAAAPGVQWTQIVGMRTVIAHAYWRIELDELWRTVQEDVPALLRELPGSDVGGS